MPGVIAGNSSPRASGVLDAPQPEVAERARGLPPRRLVTLYFGVAAVALPLACAGVAFAPRAVTGFFYHARLVALVHLVTIGWISSSILGAIYLVGPMALRMPLPARAPDYAAWACTTVGLVGLVGHFWIEEFRGMAWSAATLWVGFALVAWRVLRQLPRAPLARPIKLHLAAAFLNVLGAAGLGVLLGFDKVYRFLPGYVLTNVFAHAHLAAIGWAGMMVVGVGYRLLPMVLPAAMPTGPTLYASLVLLEGGVLGVVVGLLGRWPWLPAAALAVVAGFAAFVGHVPWMRRHRRPAPPGMPRVDYSVRHVGVAFAWLGVAAALGLALSLLPPSPWSLRAAAAYGVAGLLGFLAQMIVGIESRILPIFAWYWAFANTGFRGPVPAPYEMPDRRLQRLVFAGWTVGVPALALGLAFEAVPFVGTGGGLLLVAALLNSANLVRILRHAYRAPAGSARLDATLG